MRDRTREIAIAIAVSALAVGAMAVDHLVGTESDAGDDPGLEDPAAFLIGTAVSLGLVALLFGAVVRPAARESPDRAAKKAIVWSGLAVPSMALLFLGVPFALAGAGVALGFIGREGSRRRIATAAIVIGGLVIALGAGAYLVALIA
jgi:hypothetical protein